MPQTKAGVKGSSQVHQVKFHQPGSGTVTHVSGMNELGLEGLCFLPVSARGVPVGAGGGTALYPVPDLQE